MPTSLASFETAIWTGEAPLSSGCDRDEMPAHDTKVCHLQQKNVKLHQMDKHSESHTSYILYPIHHISFILSRNNYFGSRISNKTNTNLACRKKGSKGSWLTPWLRATWCSTAKRWTPSLTRQLRHPHSVCKVNVVEKNSFETFMGQSQYNGTIILHCNNIGILNILSLQHFSIFWLKSAQNATPLKDRIHHWELTLQKTKAKYIWYDSFVLKKKRSFGNLNGAPVLRAEKRAAELQRALQSSYMHRGSSISAWTVKDLSQSLFITHRGY